MARPVNMVPQSVREVQLVNIPLASVTASKPSHESGMLVMEVQLLNIPLAVVNWPKPAHDIGMLVREVQP